MAVKDVSKGQDSNHLCQGSTLSKEYIAPVPSLCLDKGMDNCIRYVFNLQLLLSSVLKSLKKLCESPSTKRNKSRLIILAFDLIDKWLGVNFRQSLDFIVCPCSFKQIAVMARFG